MELDEMRRSKAEDRARRARAMDEQRVIDAKHVEDESVLRKEMTVRVASDAEHVKQAEEDIRSTRKVSAVRGRCNPGFCIQLDERLLNNLYRLYSIVRDQKKFFARKRGSGSPTEHPRSTLLNNVVRFKGARGGRAEARTKSSDEDCCGGGRAS
jgi:hypothetical protein